MFRAKISVKTCGMNLNEELSNLMALMAFVDERGVSRVMCADEWRQMLEL